MQFCTGIIHKLTLILCQNFEFGSVLIQGTYVWVKVYSIRLNSISFLIQLNGSEPLVVKVILPQTAIDVKYKSKETKNERMISQ